MLDLFGTAILDFQTSNSPQDIVTETNITKPDLMRVSHLFRNFDAMPVVEQKALNLCKGKVLDVGCGAGSHSLWLQENGFEVFSLDISPNAIKTCQLRGIQNIINQDIMSFNNQKFDTILLLMNGTGIFQTIAKMPQYLQKLKQLLNPNGQILIDSTDIIYMFDKDEVEDIKHSKSKYYGELEFTISYKNKIEQPFPWLYLDYNTLKNIILDNNFQIEKIIECENYSYLAKVF